ncbi:4-carboxy-4-hydroxy-2-oxoadipate aldolase/oxaloacetate decarboxylase [Microbacterium sp. LWO13-1.2]|uniref:RraA family protein n=1 Tax=Microbacterium sp. LWO13-1.2 TaxID=3135262 RepID=UPI0031398947
MTDPTAIIAALRALDSCAISDALDTLGLPGAVIELSAMWPAGRTVAGRVRTVTAAPKASSGPVTHIATPLVAIAERDDVVVIDNHGHTDVSCWGGLLAEAAIQRGVAGVIVDGACRDVQESEALGLPVFARAAVPVSARGRIVQQAMDERIQVSGVSVASYDYVVADVNGVVFVAASDAARVVALAQRIADREARMAEAVRAGQDVSEVMHDSRFPTVTADPDSAEEK